MVKPASAEGDNRFYRYYTCADFCLLLHIKKMHWNTCTLISDIITRAVHFSWYYENILLLLLNCYLKPVQRLKISNVFLRNTYKSHIYFRCTFASRGAIFSDTGYYVVLTLRLLRLSLSSSPSETKSSDCFFRLAWKERKIRQKPGSKTINGKFFRSTGAELLA